MDRLEAIRRIVEAKDVADFSKLSGIRKVLEEDETSAEAISIAFSKPRAQCLKEAKARRAQK